MEKVILTQSEKSISISDITEFEIKKRITLPENYKQLLLKFNGGITYEHRYLFEVISLKFGEYPLEKFYDDLKINENNLLEDLFPFALTSTGGIISLNLSSGTDNGKVILLYSDREESKMIANSLEELLGVNKISEL